VLPSTLIEDRRKFGSRPPAWKETDDAKEKASLVPTAGDYPKREGPVKHKRFIMDAIETAVKAFGQAKRIQLDSLFVSPDYPVVDPDLTAPWFAAVDFAAQFKRDNKDEDHPIFGLQRQLIQDHVHTVAKRYRESMRSNFSSLRIETRQDILRDLAMEFASRPLPSQVYISEDEIARLRASYAYHHDSEEHKWNTKWTRQFCIVTLSTRI
jgi:RNA-dependent RNA polymerase